MDSARYYVALVTVVAFPPPLVAWLLIHPLADKLRRIGLAGAYVSIFSFYAVGMFAGPWLNGMIADRFGIRTMFLFTAGFFFLAVYFFIYLLYRREAIDNK